MATAGDGTTTYLVTGATSGIGRVTAESIAATGDRVFIVARNETKGSATLDEIRSATGNDDVHLLLADLSSMAQVRSLADQVHERIDRLDVLVNNAGLLVSRRELTEDGLERTLAVNHLAPLLLTHLLLDVLRAAPAPRVVTTASTAHQAGELDLDDLHWERRFYTQFRGYCASKLANVLFSAESARRWPDVHSLSVHPGSVHTGFGKEGSLWVRTGIAIGGRFVMRTPEQGAVGLTWAASDPAAADVPNGSYTMDGAVKKPARRGRDKVLAAQLWEESLRLTGLA